jgi:Ca-activated chloride channel family protein
MLAALFRWPQAWPILALVPLVLALLLVLEARRRRRLARLVGPERQQSLCSDLSAGRRRLRVILLLAGLALACTAVLQPLFGEEVLKIQQRGVDVVVCLDVSRSMLARDLPPDRLTRAKREVTALSERLRGDRMGVVAFAGEARLTIPLTQDMDTLRGLLDHVDIYSVPKGGTDLGAALQSSLAALEGASGDHEVIILLTDGEDLEGRGLAATAKAVERNITVHCVGFGSTRGSKIAVAEDGGETFLKDRSGDEVVSSMDPESLRKIAELTGGEFLRADAMPLPLVELYEKRIEPSAKKVYEEEERREGKNRFQWPLLGAVVLWLLELAMVDRRRRRR